VKYRLYIDEVGDPGLGASKDPRHRYLSITGIVIEIGYVDKVVFPEIEGLKKKYFYHHADEPIILHRKEIVNQRYPFHPLREEKIRKAFNRDLLQLLSPSIHKFGNEFIHSGLSAE
jgi:hypothetical protein